MESKKRKALSDANRLEIRKCNRTHPPAYQRDLIVWWEGQSGQKLHQSQISRILSSYYDYLDDLNEKKDKKQLESKRACTGDWPELETALFEWHQRIDKKQAVITGDLLKVQASKL